MQQLPILVPNDPSNKILLAFCQQLVTNISPKYIPNCVAIDSQKGDCFHNVAKYQSQYGGDVQYGWCLWETPGLILQAEFHAVWRSATGELVDLTPHHQILEKGIILFLPDNTRSYEGIRVNNQRIALLDDPVIHNYLLAWPYWNNTAKELSFSSGSFIS